MTVCGRWSGLLRYVIGIGSIVYGTWEAFDTSVDTFEEPWLIRVVHFDSGLLIGTLLAESLYI